MKVSKKYILMRVLFRYQITDHIWALSGLLILSFWSANSRSSSRYRGLRARIEAERGNRKVLRHGEQRGPSFPLSLSCYTLVFSLAEPSAAPLCCYVGRATQNTWRVTPVGGVMMEKATRGGEHERMGGGGGTEWSRCWRTRGEKISNAISLIPKKLT